MPSRPIEREAAGVNDTVAILLVNLGSPDAPTESAVRQYLREFLWDPHIVKFPRMLWWLILNGIILNVRTKKSAQRYASIWTEEGSPLQVHTEKQAKLLRGFLGHVGHALHVDYAMRYGNPSLPTVLNRLKGKGFLRIILLPLYPQYATSTTASVFDAVKAWTGPGSQPPEIHTIRSYHDHPAYIKALAASVRQHWAVHGRPENSYRLVMSFHGIPRYHVDRGDTYQGECLATGRLLAQTLGLDETQYNLCFQSRFGFTKWLQPYTSTTLAELGRQMVQRIDVLCPGFPTDCLESLEEIAIQGKSIFMQAGGKDFFYIPALNEKEEWIKALVSLVLEHYQKEPSTITG